MVVAFDSLDMMKNWPVKMLWKAEQTHDLEQHRQQLLVSSKMESQSKQHGNELQSVVSDQRGGGVLYIGLCVACMNLFLFDYIGLEYGVFH